MNICIRMLPLLLAGLIVAAAFGFVRYYDAYEAPGEHWAPASPITHENARFTIDMGHAGDFQVSVEKLRSKFPLFFVEYQTPGTVMTLTTHSDDGIVRLDEQFADEGDYQITVQPIQPLGAPSVVPFSVQTPLVKYTNDVLLALFLIGAGYLSGRRLRALAMVTLLITAGSLAAPQPALAHGADHDVPENSAADAITFPAHRGDVTLQWLAGKSPIGAANRTPMDWRMQITQAGKPLARAPFTLDVVHSETHLPVLHLEGIANHGRIDLRYSPPDGTDYSFQLRTVVDDTLYHLALPGSAEAIPPTAWRKWQSFLIMAVPLLIGMVWGWKRG